MAFESQNKLISSFNTDNVRQGLFRYQGNTSVSKIRGTGSGFANLTTAPDTNAGAIYNQANDLIETVVKGATQIKKVQNEEDELRQSIDASRELSSAYQTMQLKKEEALTAVDKQKVIDSFRDDVYAWSTQLTDRNRNSIESATHNFLNFEAREQARVVRQENVTELKNTMNNTSSFLLSSSPEDRNATLNAMRESYNNLGFTNEEFNEVAFGALSNNLFAGITKDNISREALYTIENTAKSFLNDFKELEGSKAYNDTLKTVESFRNALIDRDVSYVNRSIQLGDTQTFNHYNEALYRNGDITDIEYRQNKIALNQKLSQHSRTPKATYDEFKAELNNLGIDADKLSIEALKSYKLLDDVTIQKIEMGRTNSIYNALINPETDVTKLSSVAKNDPKLFDKAMKNYADTNKSTVNQLIANMYEIKDPTNEEYQRSNAVLQNIISNSVKLATNPRFVGIISDDNTSVNSLSYLYETANIINDPSMTQSEKIDHLYRNNVNKIVKVDVDNKVLADNSKAIKEAFKKEFGASVLSKKSKAIDTKILDHIQRGIPLDVTKKTVQQLYGVSKLNKNITADKTTFTDIFSKINEANIDRIDEYFVSDNYGYDAQNREISKLQRALDNREITDEQFNDLTIKAVDKAVNRTALFQEAFKEMRKKAIDEDLPISIEYDPNSKLVMVTNGVDTIPTNLDINNVDSFVQHFNDFSGDSYYDLEEKSKQEQSIVNTIGGVGVINNSLNSGVKIDFSKKTKSEEKEETTRRGGVGNISPQK